jgi:dTDP-4-amino-4,6-dideoxygalactose transaminase
MQNIAAKKPIPLWNIEVGEPEIESIGQAIRNRKVAQGALTEELQKELASMLGVPYVACTTSGTAALMLAYMAIGLRPGDEVILPDRTFIATANAAMMLGASVRLVDVHPDRPLLDPAGIEARITERTRAIVPVHLNGRAADMDAIQAIADRHGLAVIEDAAQALLSKRGARYLGTLARFGCFSLGMAKLLTTGQGGFITCHTKEDHLLIQRLKNQGVFDVNRNRDYGMLAGNFKYTDIQAAMGLAQMKRLPGRMERQRQIYHAYAQGLASVGCLRCVDVHTDRGELPLRAEFLCTERDKFISIMAEHGVPVLSQPPNLHESLHLSSQGPFENGHVYSQHLITLPCGPDQAMEHVEQVIEIVQGIDRLVQPWQARGVDPRPSL